MKSLDFSRMVLKLPIIVKPNNHPRDCSFGDSFLYQFKLKIIIMKITFFDTFPHEEAYLSTHLPEGIEAVYINTSLHPATKTPDETLNSDIISVFTPSLLNRETLEKFPNLKFILLRSVGFSHVDMQYTRNRDIHVFNTPNYGDYTVAEYVFASLLSLIRKIPQSNNALRMGNILLDKYVGLELYSKTMGVIGTGAIGSKVVKIAKGFSMDVIAYDINKNTDAEYVSLDELCKRADIISINTPLTPDTLRMFDRNRLNSLKKGVIIVNTARGEIIDTNALYDAILDKRVAYAALDVIECEDMLWQKPHQAVYFDSIKENCLKNFLVANRLLKMDNVLITPHTAYDTKEATKRILEITVENINSCINFSAGAKNQVLV